MGLFFFPTTVFRVQDVSWLVTMSGLDIRKDNQMARKPNYGFEKRQKELAKKAKKEEKNKRKQDEKSSDAADEEE